MRLIKILLTLICSATFARAAAPAAPTNFKVTPLGTNAFLLKWKDNSKNEVGWEISAILSAKEKPVRYSLVPIKDIQSFVLKTNSVPDRVISFQLRAYNGAPGAEVLSKPSKVVTVTTPGPATFDAPSGLKTKALDDGRIRLQWKDNANSELGYQIESRRGNKGKWGLLGTTDPGVKFKIDLAGLAPDRSYSFRVRAVRTVPVPNVTAYSNIATAKTMPFRAPAGLVGTLSGEANVALRWTDRSSLEAGFELETRRGSSGAFRKLADDLGFNTISINVEGLAFDSDHQFRIRAFRLDGSTRIYTTYSNVFSVRTPKIATPGAFTLTVLSDSKLRLSWTHASARLGRFEVQYRVAGASTFATVSSPSKDQRQLELIELDSNSSYEFRMLAHDDSGGTSNFSGVVQGKTDHGLLSNLRPPIVVNQFFLYRMLASNPGGISNVTVTGLPAGLSFDAVARTIKGTVTVPGNYSATITITYSNGKVSVRTLKLSTVSRAPVALSSFANMSVAVAEQKTVSAVGKFADPDTESAVRVNTNLGSFAMILFPDATPMTVGNFLAYVDGDLYNDMVFHRAPPSFVVQGGGFKHTVAGGYARIPTFAEVVNEPGLTNVRGTVAMAKLPNLPNSATSQFFVNLDDDDAANLDGQNGGFTVFGRVPNAGMTVVDQIAGLPKETYTFSVSGMPVGTNPETFETRNVTFEDFPVNANPAPAVPSPSELVKVSSVVPADILTYSVVSQNPAVASALMNGTNVVITGVAKGTTSINVRATDLDGQHVTGSISVTVP